MYAVPFFKEQELGGYDSRPGLRADCFCQFGQELRRRLCVVIQNNHHASARGAGGPVDRADETSVLAAGHNARLNGTGLHPCYGLVAAGVVREDDLKIGESL